MVNVVYAIVFGPTWNQISYITDYSMARSALIMYTVRKVVSGFNPFMMEFVSKNGTLVCDHTFDVHPAYLGRLESVADSNLYAAFDFIRLV